MVSPLNAVSGNMSLQRGSGSMLYVQTISSHLGFGERAMHHLWLGEVWSWPLYGFAEARVWFGGVSTGNAFESKAWHMRTLMVILTLNRVVV
jgi:hypothetical protein